MYNIRLNGRGYAVPRGTEPGPGIPVGAVQGDYVLSLEHLLSAVRKRLWIILLMPVVLMGMAVGFSLVQTPTYEASIRVLVGQESGITQNPGDVAGLQQLTRTMTEAVDSRLIAETVVDELNLQMTPEAFLEEHLSVEQVPETQFIQVNYEDSSPERAQQVADTIGDVLSEQVSEVSPSASAITVTVWDRALTPDEPVSPNPVRNGLLALTFGLLLGLGLALLLEYLDNSWRSPEEVEQVSGVPTFGVIPEFKTLAAKRGE